MTQQNHRPEVGTTQGVDQWAAGEHYCTIICSNGHKKRTIDRIKYAGEKAHGGHLYTAAFRLDDPFGVDPGTSAEDNPVNSDTKWRFPCPSCKLDVVLDNDSLEKLALWVSVANKDRLQLDDLAAIMSR